MRNASTSSSSSSSNGGANKSKSTVIREDLDNIINKVN